MRRHCRGNWRGLTLLPALLLLGGCPDSVQNLEDRALEHAGRERTYKLFVPPQYDGNDAVPLVVLLHPFTGDGRSMASMTEFSLIAQRENIIVAYPDGLLRRWDDERLDGWDDHGFILALVNRLFAEFNIDAARVYLAGASNGGFMTYSLVCEAPGVFAAVATVMSTMPQRLLKDCVPPADLPLLIVHGTSDALVPFEGGPIFRGPTNGVTAVLGFDETVEFWRAAAALGEPTETSLINPVFRDSTRVVRSAYHTDVAGPPLLVTYKVIGGGHTWPGGGGAKLEPIMGRRAEDISASEEIWAFFRQHSLPQ